MLRKIIKRVLFGKRKNYKRRGINKNSMSYNYVSWRAFDRLRIRVDNLLEKLEMQKVGNGSLIGDKKDAKKFKNQYDF